ncbi:unnamed protein product, partial [Amoebophrya sp. A25]
DVKSLKPDIRVRLEFEIVKIAPEVSAGANNKGISRTSSSSSSNTDQKTAAVATSSTSKKRTKNPTKPVDSVLGHVAFDINLLHSQDSLSLVLDGHTVEVVDDRPSSPASTANDRKQCQTNKVEGKNNSCRFLLTRPEAACTTNGDPLQALEEEICSDIIPKLSGHIQVARLENDIVFEKFQ